MKWKSEKEKLEFERNTALKNFDDSVARLTDISKFTRHGNFLARLIEFQKQIEIIYNFYEKLKDIENKLKQTKTR